MGRMWALVFFVKKQSPQKPKFINFIDGSVPKNLNPNSTSRIYQNFSPGLAFGPVDENMTSVYMGI